MAENHHPWCEVHQQRSCTCAATPSITVPPYQLDDELVGALIAAADTLKSAQLDGVDHQDELRLKADLARAARRFVAHDQSFVDDLIAALSSRAFPPDDPNTRGDINKVFYALYGINPKPYWGGASRIPHPFQADDGLLVSTVISR